MKLSDFKFASKILFGNKVKVPTFVVPASTQIAKELEVETYKGVSLKQIFEQKKIKKKKKNKKKEGT